MLVLSRKPRGHAKVRGGDTIVFPELGIRICINEVRGLSVRVGVDAPRDIKVLRGEHVVADEAA